MTRGCLPWLVVIRGLTFIPFRLYGGLWRYTGIWDLSRIVLAVFASSFALHLLVYRPLGPALYPRSLVIIDTLLLVSFLGGLPEGKEKCSVVAEDAVKAAFP